MSSRGRWGLVLLGTVLVCSVTFGLGRWQLSRAAQKQAVVDAMTAQEKLAPVDVQVLASGGDLDKHLHRPVRLRGHWLAQRTVFLDNRPMGGQAGLYVVTPLRLDGTSQVVLVQRGWVARNFLDRTQVPEVPTPAGLVALEGRLATFPSKLYAFQGEDLGRIRQNLDLHAFSAELGVSLLSVSVRQTGPGPDGLRRDWPTFESGIQKHYGYAFQWFGLCGLFATLFIWFQIVRRYKQARRTAPQHPA